MTDLMLFRRATPSPVPKIFSPSEKDESTNVDSDSLNETINTSGNTLDNDEHLTSSRTNLTASAFDERRWSIQSVR